MANTELKEVYLYNNQIEDEGMNELARCFSNKKSLFALGLEFNKIGAEGIAKVLMAVKNLKDFEKLFINANDIKGSPQLGNAFIEFFS